MLHLETGSIMNVQEFYVSVNHQLSRIIPSRHLTGISWACIYVWMVRMCRCNPYLPVATLTISGYPRPAGKCMESPQFPQSLNVSLCYSTLPFVNQHIGGWGEGYTQVLFIAISPSVQRDFAISSVQGILSPSVQGDLQQVI